MSKDEVYGVQSFVRNHKGVLEQGRNFECRNEDGAKETAKSRVASGYAVGAIAFARHGGGEFDEGEIRLLATFGEVPAGNEID